MLKEEIEKLYLVITRWNVERQLVTRKEYCTPNTIKNLRWNYYDIQKQVQQDMRQKMMQGKCFISYKLPTRLFTFYIYAFKIHGCDEP